MTHVLIWVMNFNLLLTRRLIASGVNMNGQWVNGSQMGFAQVGTRTGSRIRWHWHWHWRTLHPARNSPSWNPTKRTRVCNIFVEGWVNASHIYLFLFRFSFPFDCEDLSSRPPARSVAGWRFLSQQLYHFPSPDRWATLLDRRRRRCVSVVRAKFQLICRLFSPLYFLLFQWERGIIGY